ncbi:MAG: hypothetical protein KatS3mg010_1916 [Acidimicrobiia bacterium]|nr:MAG: hypothetical protein KatS3mg010_1916 [Acidimicrobiia bacterium]
MQIMVEGLALAAFGFMHQMTDEPLLKQLLRYVMSDEARHVAFGVLSLQEYYAEPHRRRDGERQEFAFEAAVRMRDRFLQQEVWERMGVTPRRWRVLIRHAHHRLVPEDPVLQDRAQLQEARPARRGDGWLRQRFTEIGVIQFEDWADTGEEYAMLDEVAKDRQAVAGA